MADNSHARLTAALGMATVYLAQDLQHARHVAIKVLRPELAAVIGGERFLTEITTTANRTRCGTLMPRLLPPVAILCSLYALAAPARASGQSPSALPADVSTIEGIVRAYYDVISGPPGAPRQWRRDSTLYMPGATFVAMKEQGGKPAADVMTPEDFRRAYDRQLVKLGFYETEIGHRSERFGHVAQVRSVYETRRTATGPVLGRGVNYLLLYWDGTRWWITGVVWDDERPDNSLPDSWIGPR